MAYSNPRPFHGLMAKLSVGFDRYELLDQFGWYRNMLGLWVNPRQNDYMSIREIRSLNLAQLEYKLKHGSRAMLPDSMTTATM